MKPRSVSADSSVSYVEKNNKSNYRKADYQDTGQNGMPKELGGGVSQKVYADDVRVQEAYVV